MMEAGADCIVDVCSFCHLQFEVCQAELNKELRREQVSPARDLLYSAIGTVNGV